MEHMAITEIFLSTDLYCPNCGSKSVWVEDDSGDYYEGADHICYTCETIFTIPSLRIDDSVTYKKTFEEIKKKLEVE